MTLANSPTLGCMTRLIGLLLVIGLGWLIVKRALGATRPAPRRPPPPRFEKTVRCARCGVVLPLSLARRQGEDYVCGGSGCDTTSRSPRS